MERRKSRDRATREHHPSFDISIKIRYYGQYGSGDELVKRRPAAEVTAVGGPPITAPPTFTESVLPGV